MPEFFELANGLGTSLVPLLTAIIIIIGIYLVFNFLLGLVKKNLLKVVKTKKQISNVEIFSTTIRYVFLFLLALSVIFYYSGSWTGLGLTLGLFSAAIGFALQRPIAGVAAWIMIVTRRPFEIGDRIIIGGAKGDVRDINMMHITLKEIGGIVPSEETSGRMILVPNAMLFEQNIVNYSQQGEFVLDQVVFTVTYESNLGKAIEIAAEATKKQIKQFAEALKKEPYIRTYFQDSGINVHARYFVPAKRMQETSSAITKDIFERIRKTKDVRFAYPHRQIVLKK